MEDIFYVCHSDEESVYAVQRKTLQIEAKVSRLSGNQKQELEQEPPPGSVKVTQHRNSA